MSEEKSIFGELYDMFFGKPIPMWIGSVLIAGMSVALFLLAQPFGASCAIVNWGQNIYGWNIAAGGAAMDTVAYKCAMGCITLIIGAFGAALLSKTFAIRVAPVGELVKGLIGGLLMAFGAVIGKGCTLGSFFSGWAMLSGGALVFAGGLFIGAFLAAKWLLFEVDKWPGISSGKSWQFNIPKKLQPWLGLLVIIVALSFPFLFGYDMDVQAERVVVGFIVISVFIGIILQRSRWCVVRALREPWMSGDSTATVAIIAGIFTGMIGMATYKFMFGGSIAMVFVFPHFWVRALMGGTIFGIGMTIAGGCAVGSMWRSAEGQVKLMIALLTMIFVMPLVAKYTMAADGALNTWFGSMTYGKMPVYLPNVPIGDGVLGYGGAIALVSAILMLWYWIAKWNDRTGKLAA